MNQSKYNETKQSIYKWRDANIDKYRESQRNYQKEHYEENKAKISIQKKKAYMLKKELEIFRNILL